MDWDWNNIFLACMAALFCFGVLREIEKLKKHVHMEDLTATKKWRKAVAGPRYVPKHKPDEVSEYADEQDRRFYRDFAPAADYLNRVYEDTPWSFENTGRLEWKGFDSSAEREIEIRYNQQKTGWIKLSCIGYGDEHLGAIRANLSLINARIFGGYEVFGLAQTIGQIVTDTPDERRENKTNISLAMVNAMWEVGEGSTGNPEVEISFEGRAEWYLSQYLPKHATQ